MQRLMILGLAFVLAAPFATPPDAAAAQTPPEEQNPWKCYDDIGWERPCSASEEFDRCLRAAYVAWEQCSERDEGAWHEVGCFLGYQADYAECELEFIKNFFF